MSDVQSTVGNLGNKKQRVRIETKVFSRGWNLTGVQRSDGAKRRLNASPVFQAGNFPGVFSFPSKFEKVGNLIRVLPMFSLFVVDTIGCLPTAIHTCCFPPF